MFAADPFCKSCDNKIMDIRHAEVDHIIPWSKGGTTSPDNAALMHRFCNRSKGARVDQVNASSEPGLPGKKVPGFSDVEEIGRAHV